MEILLLAVVAAGCYAVAKSYGTGKRVGARGGYAACRRRMKRR
jgi:hypothetical protein